MEWYILQFTTIFWFRISVVHMNISTTTTTHTPNSETLFNFFVRFSNTFLAFSNEVLSNVSILISLFGKRHRLFYLLLGTRYIRCFELCRNFIQLLLRQWTIIFFVIFRLHRIKFLLILGRIRKTSGLPVLLLLSMKSLSSSRCWHLEINFKFLRCHD